jgi:hypothetical protein
MTRISDDHKTTCSCMELPTCITEGILLLRHTACPPLGSSPELVDQQQLLELTTHCCKRGTINRRFLILMTDNIGEARACAHAISRGMELSA